ncbi:MAG: helicase associated domain-containing protein [Bacteroidaceae bacterium]|nr:helicase associated domain-containing protein [Bacteroidaceae bacterium]
MKQEQRWMAKYNEVVYFIETNKRNPSKHDEEERGKYLNWIKANRKALNAGKMKPERVEKFKELVALTEQYRRKNQYE